MYPRIIEAKPLESFELMLVFDNGENRKLNIKKYFVSEYFLQLSDWDYFRKVRVKGRVVVWPNEQDIAPETLYLDSEPVN